MSETAKIESMETRVLLSSASGAPNEAILHASPVVQEGYFWTLDYSPLPEGQPVAFNSKTGVQYTFPTISPTGRIQINGTTAADHISVEEVDHIDSNSDLSVVVFSQDPDVQGEYPNTNAAQGKWRWQWRSLESEMTSDVKRAWDYAKKLLSEDNENLNEELTNPVEFGSTDIPYYQKQIPIDEQNVAAMEGQDNIINGQSLTRIRVEGKYDVYVEDGDTPLTIAIDSGAGNDTISVAPMSPPKPRSSAERETTSPSAERCTPISPAAPATIVWSAAASTAERWKADRG